MPSAGKITAEFEGDPSGFLAEVAACKSALGDLDGGSGGGGGFGDIANQAGSRSDGLAAVETRALEVRGAFSEMSGGFASVAETAGDATGAIEEHASALGEGVGVTEEYADATQKMIEANSSAGESFQGVQAQIEKTGTGFTQIQEQAGQAAIQIPQFAESLQGVTTATQGFADQAAITQDNYQAISDILTHGSDIFRVVLEIEPQAGHRWPVKSPTSIRSAVATARVV